jgi:hypothetical protein
LCMSQLAEIFKVIVPTVVVPMAVFGVNWTYRANRGYAQTAASDFILAVLIFDGGVVAVSQEFEPFIRHPELRHIIVYWHMTIAVIGGAIWWCILKWGEPVVAEYYETKRNRPRFPFFTLAFCWMAVFALVAAHVGFFVLKGNGHG